MFVNGITLSRDDPSHSIIRNFKTKKCERDASNAKMDFMMQNAVCLDNSDDNMLI